jgi:hypothetical protein
VQPFERLRRLARDSDDDDQWFVAEAADCLAGFAHDPAGLVVACRRLLAHHPAAGVLWWLCARVLTAASPSEAAWEACDVLEQDRTARRLGERLPFPHDEPVAVLGWPGVVAAALSDRPDLDVLAVPRRQGDARLRYRVARSEASVRIVTETQLAAAAPSHLLVEASAASPTEAVVDFGASDLLAELAPGRVTTVLVAAGGRLLPERLLGALRTRLEAGDRADASWELVPVDRFARVAGPDGLRDPSSLSRRIDCPVAPELLRIA